MGRPYSMDLRERVISRYQRGDVTLEEVASQFEIGIATVNRWLRRTREEGSPVVHPPGRGPKPLIGDSEWVLVEGISRARPDTTMQEVAWILEEEHGLKVSRATVQKAVQTRGWRSKKSIPGA